MHAGIHVWAPVTGLERRDVVGASIDMMPPHSSIVFPRPFGTRLDD
jgi:hypothetical protein